MLWLCSTPFLAAASLFFFANRPAYKAYFSDDDLDKMGWPTVISNGDFIKEILTPKLSEGNFRPIGYLYYRYMGRIFKLNYRPWVVVLQAGHLINVILLFFVLRRFGFSDFAGVGCWAFYGVPFRPSAFARAPQSFFAWLALIVATLVLFFYMCVCVS